MTEPLGFTPAHIPNESAIGLRHIFLRALAKSRADMPHKWQRVILILEGRRARAMSREDFAAWSRACGREAAAVTATTRAIPRGCVLVWMPGEPCGFADFDMDKAAALARKK